MPNTVTLQIGKQKREIPCPESWDDFADLRTFLLFYQTLFSLPGDEYTATAFTAVKLISMTQKVLGMDTASMAIWEAERRKTNPELGEAVFLEELRQVVHHVLGGLFTIEDGEEAGTKYACKLNRLRNPWPILENTKMLPAGKGKKLPGKTTNLYAPADGLSNLTAYELGVTFTLFENYLNTNEEQYADQLLGVLYRPTRPLTAHEKETAWGGDRRQKFRGYEAKMPERAALMATLPALTRRVLLFWFASCRQSIVDAYPKVFRRTGGQGGRAGSNYGWGGVLLSVAEVGSLGPLNDVADAPYANVLTLLSMKAEEAEAMEEWARAAGKK